jgi:hypothetical protein
LSRHVSDKKTMSNVSPSTLPICLLLRLLSIAIFLLIGCNQSRLLVAKHPTDLGTLSLRYKGLSQRVLAIRGGKKGVDDSQEAFQSAVRDLWECVREWTVAQFTLAGAIVDVDNMAKRIEALDPARECSEHDYGCFEEFHLSADVLDLHAKGYPAYVVSVGYPRMGTFFIVSKNDAGQYHDAWNIFDIALKHYASKDEIGYWAYLCSVAYSDAPLVGSAHPLPCSSSGAARFYVDAFAALEAGGTFPKQLGVWEWDGLTAKPLLVRNYLSSFESGEVTFNGSELRIPTKGHYKRFFSCGQCTEPLVIWTVRVDPEGVSDQGLQDAIPEVRLADELWDRIFSNRDMSDIAAPGVIKTVQDLYQSLKAENEQYGMFDSLAMLGASKVFADVAGRHLYFNADDLNCNELRFLVEERNGHLFFSALDLHDKCEYTDEKCPEK